MISCICCHYGRTWLLAEAIESYIRQTYTGKSELIIVNDHPDVTVRVDTSKLKPYQSIWVINWSERMATLSHKFDYGATLAQYPLIVMWDDDDIALPNRLSYQVTEWRLAGEPDYLSFGRHFYVDQHGPHLVARGLHGGDILTREAYWQCGGSCGDGHNDQNLVAEMKAQGRYSFIDDCVPTYLYRWTGIAGHHSAHLSLDEAMLQFDRAVRRSPHYKEGEVVITPGYTPKTEDLVAECIKLSAREAKRQLQQDEKPASGAENG